MGQARSRVLSVESLRFVFEGPGAERGQEMDMKLRVFTVIVTMIVGGFIVGCGSEDDTEDSPAPTVEKEPELNFGLDGDTYRNRRLFKIANLPVDDWTVKEVTKAVEGKKEEDFLGWVPLPLSLYYTTYAREEEFFFDQVTNGVISLLLMQPTSKEDFVDTLPEAFANQIPFIYIFIELQSGTDFDSSKEAAVQILEVFTPPFDWQDKTHEVTSQGAISSLDRRHGYFWEIALSAENPLFFNEQIVDTESKAKQSFFLSRLENNRFIYRLLFWAPTDQYDKYVPVYDKIVSSVEFRL